MTTKEKIIEYLKKERQSSQNSSKEYLVAKMPDAATRHADIAKDYTRAIVIIHAKM